MGEVSTKGIWGMDNRANLAILRAQQQLVLNTDKRITFVPTSHLAFDVMGSGQPHYHFGTQGQLQMGDAFADAYLGKTGKTRVLTRRPSPKFPPKGSRVHLIVLAGQRNAEGEDAFVQDLMASPQLAKLASPQRDVMFRYSIGGGVQQSTDWEALHPTSTLGNFGPELSLGAALRESIPASDAIAIVKFTHSGAQIPDWSPSGSAEANRNLYKAFVDFAMSAINDLKKRGYDVSIDALFWHAGENDTYFGPYVRGYAQRLNAFFTQLRSDISAPDITFYVSKQHPKSPWVNIEQMNRELDSLATTKGQYKTVVINTDQLPHGKVHFGTDGIVALGNAYAAAYKTRNTDNN
jgi:hypothetical protein